MILVDKSVSVKVLKDKSGKVVHAFQEKLGEETYCLTRFTQLELLQAAKDEGEWSLLDQYLSMQYYLEASENTWRDAARIYFELRRKGITVNSPIDFFERRLGFRSRALPRQSCGNHNA